MSVRFLSVLAVLLCSISSAEEKVKPVSVPLPSIVTTSPQKGMLHVKELLDQ